MFSANMLHRDYGIKLTLVCDNEDALVNIIRLLNNQGFTQIAYF